MGEPIFERLLADVRQGEQLAERARKHLTLVHHTEGTTPMSALSDVETTLNQWADDLQGKIDQLRNAALPAIHDGAATADRLAASPIVAELENLTAPLDPQLEQMVAGIIRSAGDAAAKIAVLTAPPAPEPVPDEQPEPAA